MKFLDIEGETFAFETLEQLIDMLKDNDYDVNLNVRKIGKIKKTIVVL